MKTQGTQTDPPSVKASWPARLVNFLRPPGRLLARPVLAYCLVLVLIYPAYLGFRGPKVVKEVIREKQIVEVPKIVGGIGTTRDYLLGASDIRGGAEPKRIVLSGRDEFFTLSFFIPIQVVPNFRYDVEIKRADGTLVGRQQQMMSRDGIGNFSVICSRQLFSDGDYGVRVFKVSKKSAAVVHEYTFNFNISHVTR